MATDNRADAMDAKAELREWLLERLPGARVLDCYAGVDGEMHARVWHRVAEYTGIDRRIRVQSDGRRRLVGNTLRLLGQIDLSAYDVFDVDAYGSPWEALREIGARRRFTGEVGFALTDGTQAKAKFGVMSGLMAELLGRSSPRFVYEGIEQLCDMHRRCLARWCVRHGLRVVDARWYTSLAGAQGSLAMTYSAAVVRPVGAQ
jgi:hypothetical protein